MRLQTINVIEYSNGSVQGVCSWTDHKRGNREAEETFKACVKFKLSNISIADIESCVKNGYFSIGDYEVYLTHSN